MTFCKLLKNIAGSFLKYFAFSYKGHGGGSRFGGGDRGGRFGGGMGGYGGAGRGNSMKGQEPGARLRKPNWDLSRLPKFEKNFYSELPTVAARSMVRHLVLTI